jgi:hypothetical protein
MRKLHLSLMLLVAGGLSLAVLAGNPAPPSAPGNEIFLTGYGSSSGSSPGASGAVGSASDAAGSRHPATFTISGSVRGLYPGRTVSLVLTVRNPLKSAITVREITTTVHNASTRCASANLQVKKFSGALVVKAGKTRKATIHATMAKSAPNSCQGARFPLRYTGSARVR